MPDDPNAFNEAQELAQSLEARGLTPLEIIDAMFRLVVRASIRIAGPAGTAQSLREMAALVEGEDLDEKPTAH